MIEALRPAYDLIMSNVYVAASAIVVVAFVASVVIDLIVSRVCLALTRRTSTTFDDRLLQLLHHPIRTTVFLFGLSIALEHLDVGDGPTRFAIGALELIVLVVWTVFAVRFIGLAVGSMAATPQVSFVVPRTEPLLANVARILIFAASVYVFFLIVGVQPTAWLASAGVVGLAVGFAAQDTLSNLFAGIFILADAPYKLGDMINLDGGDRGMVTHIGLRSTRLLRRDDVEVTLPNAIIANARIMNESGGPSKKHRIGVAVGVAYGSDVDEVEAILKSVAEANDRVVDDPAPRVRFRQFGASSLDFELLSWIGDPRDRGITKHELNRAIYKRFAADGVEIPFPQRDLWIKEMPKREK
jgi:MscS family membrane protein